MKKSTYRVCGMVLAMAVALGCAPVTTGNAAEKTEKTAKVMVADTSVSGPSTTVVTGPVSLDITDINSMAGKTIKLSVVNIPGGASVASAITFTSDNEAVAKPTKMEFAADYSSVTCSVVLVAEGETVVRANAFGQSLACNVRVVPAFSKADFSYYRPTNFVTAFKNANAKAKKKNKKGYAWYYDGEWGQPAKYGTTYRGVRIGKSMDEVKQMYGDLDLKKCDRKKDPFLYEKQFNSGKKLKVSQYVEFVYKESKDNYRLRIYFTPGGKVHGFIMLAGKSFDKISKSDYQKSRRSGEKLI